MKIVSDKKIYDNIKVIKSKYLSNGRLAVYVLGEKGFKKVISKNIPSSDITDPKTCAYIDTESYPWASAFLVDNSLAVSTTKTAKSGAVFFPEYQFDLGKMI